MIVRILNVLGFFGLIFLAGYIVGSLKNLLLYFIGMKKAGEVLVNPLSFFDDDKNSPYPYIKHVLLVLFSIGAIWGVLSFAIQKEEMGSIFEKKEYQAKYYVNLYSENKKVFRKRVAADIVASWQEHDYGNGDAWNERAYYLSKVYLEREPLDFESMIGFEPLKLDKMVYQKDESGKWWYVELTNEMVTKQ